MASTLTSTAVGSGVQPRTAHASPCTKTATYALAAALVVNDVIQMVKVPKGARVLTGWLIVDDLDSHATPLITLSVGDGDSTARYLSASTIGQAGGQAVFNIGHGTTYTAEDTIDVLVAAAPATGATTGNVTLTVLYTTQD